MFTLVRKQSSHRSALIPIEVMGAIVAGGCLLIASTNALADYVPLGDIITNGNFGTDASPSLTGWTTTGGTGNVNARASTNAINTQLGNSGFNPTNTANTKFFNSAFAVLGDNNTVTSPVNPANTQTITSNDNPNVGTFTLAQNFTLPSTSGGLSVKTVDIDFTFSAIFDGLDSSSTSNNDVFSVYIENLDDSSQTSLVSKDSNGLRTTNFSTGTNIPQINLSGTYSATDLIPGNYRLVFQLSEISGTGTSLTNTAVGIDTVSTSGTIHRISEPSSLPLWGIGLLGLLRFKRRHIG